MGLCAWRRPSTRIGASASTSKERIASAAESPSQLIPRLSRKDGGAGVRCGYAACSSARCGHGDSRPRTTGFGARPPRRHLVAAGTPRESGHADGTGLSVPRDLLDHRPLQERPLPREGALPEAPERRPRQLDLARRDANDARPLADRRQLRLGGVALQPPPPCPGPAYAARGPPAPP